MSDFAHQKVLVTGAAGVLGRAVAQAFHAGGATVVGVDIAPDDAPWRTIVADLIDPAGAEAALAQAGDIDILANIAGGFAMGEGVADTSDDTWDFMMNLNARTVLNVCRAALPGMVGRGHGKIVNIGARGALRGSALMGAYIASKSVVMRLTETLSDEVKGKASTSTASCRASSTRRATAPTCRRRRSSTGYRLSTSLAWCCFWRRQRRTPSTVR